LLRRIGLEHQISSLFSLEEFVRGRYVVAALCARRSDAISVVTDDDPCVASVSESDEMIFQQTHPACWGKSRDTKTNALEQEEMHDDDGDIASVLERPESKGAGLAKGTALPEKCDNSRRSDAVDAVNDDDDDDHYSVSSAIGSDKGTQLAL